MAAYTVNWTGSSLSRFSMSRNHYLKTSNSRHPSQDLSLGYFLKSIKRDHPPELLNTPVETAEQE
jgi:hypothetical protein